MYILFLVISKICYLRIQVSIVITFLEYKPVEAQECDIIL